jgi:hypothetical protein
METRNELFAVTAPRRTIAFEFGRNAQMWNRHPWAWGLLLTLLIGGCRQEPTSPTEDATAKPAATTPRELAKQAQEDLFDQLLRRLTDALSRGGPAAAISICRDEAPQIARSVAKKHGVAIGRTSFRLRNPRNTPPEWALPLVEQKVTEPQFVELPDGRLGALLPIRLKPQCTLCHGPAAELAADVKTALAEQYPEDQATGFREGDLRGWFWVEVPGTMESDSG